MTGRRCLGGAEKGGGRPAQSLAASPAHSLATDPANETLELWL